MTNAVQYVFPITLAASGPTHRNPVIVTGEWVKDGKKIVVTLDDLRTMMANFAKCKNREVNVDYDHASEYGLKASQGQPLPSAGALVSLEEPQPFIDEAGDGGGERWIVYGQYNFTPTAAEMIAKREYRYVSPAFGHMPDRVTGKAQGFTLSTVALTNRPLFWEMPEVFAASINKCMSPEAVHVPTAMGEEKPQHPAAAGKEKNMTTTKCCLKASADGKHEVYDGDGDDAKKIGEIEPGHLMQYAKTHLSLATAEEMGKQEAAGKVLDMMNEAGCKDMDLASVKTLIEKGKAAPAVAAKTDVEQITACIDEAKGTLNMASVDDLQDNGKIKASSHRKAVAAEQKVTAAFNQGKVKPTNRVKALKLCLADEAAFDEFIAGAKPVVDLKTRGTDRAVEAGEKVATLQFASLVKERMTDLKLSEDAAKRNVLATAEGSALWEAMRLEELAESAAKK